MSSACAQQRRIKAGYRFRNFSGEPMPIVYSTQIPKQVLIPMVQGFGFPVRCLVKPGDKVMAGQVIGRDDDHISSPVHATVNGKVISISEYNYLNRKVEMVVIESNGEERFQKVNGASSQWQKLEPVQIEEILYKTGATALSANGLPTHFRTSIITPEQVEDLLIYWISDEPYNPSLELLLGDKGLLHFITGIKILKKIYPGAIIHIVFSREKRSMIEAIGRLIVEIEDIRIYAVEPKYPISLEEVLIPTILNKEFPYGYSSANIGVLTLDVQGVLQVYEAVVEGKPLIERIIALAGTSFNENIHLRVRVGTPLNDILHNRLKPVPSKIFLNSLIRGTIINDLSLPIARNWSQIIAIPEEKKRKFLPFLRLGSNVDSYTRTFGSSFFKMSKKPDTNLHGSERPCIQCGYCADVCPVNLEPMLIMRLTRLGINENLMRYNIFNCIECNLCSYVCPSKIRISEVLRKTKKQLIELGCDNYLCIGPKFDLRGIEEYQGIKQIK